MAVTAKKLNGAQRRCVNKFERISGFEFMHQDEIDDGTMTFAEAWAANTRWLEYMVADVTNINTNGAVKCLE